MLVNSFSKCVNYEDFSARLKEIEKSFETKTQAANSVEKVLEFIECHQGIFMQEKRAAIPLSALGAKVRHLIGHEPLIRKLYSYVNLLIPSASQKRNDFLELIRASIFDPTERIQAISDWIDLMRIPLAQLELTEDEFIGILTRLEYPDLTNFNFQSIDLETLAVNLLKPNLRFKTTDTVFLFTLPKFVRSSIGYGLWTISKTLRLQMNRRESRLPSCARGNIAMASAFLIYFWRKRSKTFR